MIPRLIHFVWIGEPMPAWAERNIAEFQRLNPGHEVRIHGAEALHHGYRPAWEAARDVTQRADLLRYSVLEREGGWYFDTDFWPFRPLADAERAWGLDGSRIAIARQHGQRNAALTVANAPLACAPKLPVWGAVRARVLSLTPPAHRTSYGPEIALWLLAERADDVTVMDWPWWFPSSIAAARKDLAEILGGDPIWARRMCAETGGQLPFAMHLWAGGRIEMDVQEPLRRAVLLEDAGSPTFTKLARPCALWPLGHPLAAAREGLLAAGFEIDCGLDFKPGGRPALAVVWNGRREYIAGAVARMRALGVPVYHLEHGFLRRREYLQCDHGGFLHYASWAKHWPEPRADAETRLKAVWPETIRPVRARQSGYVLIVGQNAGDTQLEGAELAGPAPLERLVARALPHGVPAFFRPHPLALARDAARIGAGQTYLPRLAGGLAEALAGARFAVQINSNTAVEATLSGLPLVEFGPSLARYAGVSKHATTVTLAEDLDKMLRGWEPEPEKVRRYLLWLACRQYRVDELRDAEFWEARACRT